MLISAALLTGATLGVLALLWKQRDDGKTAPAPQAAAATLLSQPPNMMVPAKDKPLPRISFEEDDGIETTVVGENTVSADDDIDTLQPLPPRSSMNVIWLEPGLSEASHLPSTRILVSAVGQTDQGRVRRRNEDNYLVMPDRSLFVVADGMGGYAGGALASSLAVETIRRAFDEQTFSGDDEPRLPAAAVELGQALQMSNRAIFHRASEDPAVSQMGTTVVAARFCPARQRLYAAHVGDSRMYRLRDRALVQITTDHTMGELGMTGPCAAHLSRAVGIRAGVDVDLIVDAPRVGDLYVLCSDGLSKMLPDDQVKDILLQKADLDEAVLALIGAANDRGGRDNVTVILVRVLENDRQPSRASTAS